MSDEVESLQRQIAELKVALEAEKKSHAATKSNSEDLQNRLDEELTSYGAYPSL